MGMILIRFQFLINVNSISIISWVLLSISITISITKTDPYQYQYIINFSKFSLSISIPISILHFFLINISLSMHCATLDCGCWQKLLKITPWTLNPQWNYPLTVFWENQLKRWRVDIQLFHMLFCKYILNFPHLNIGWSRLSFLRPRQMTINKSKSEFKATTR